MQREPAPVDLVVALEVDVGPVQFEVPDDRVIDYETLFVIHCELNSLVPQLLDAHVGEREVEVLVENGVVSLFLYL